jgi:HSP20 family protein
MNISRYEPRYRPLGLLGRLLQDQDLERLLSTSVEPDSVSDWLPAVDICEEEDRFVLLADLPGVDPENIDIAMENGVLTIQGYRESETTDEQTGYKRYERVSGSFMRRFTLPDTANQEEISAETRHGVLEISIPKQVKKQPRKIDVRPA